MEPRTRARLLRNNPTEAEVRLWRAISARQVAGIRFNRQVPIGPYICDFVARGIKLVVEVDGGQHASDDPAEMRRTAFLQSQGFHVVRFWNHDVLSNLAGVVAEIERVIAALPSPSPSRSREGSEDGLPG
ncbi:endonuclease domain-containing protein [Sphingomonas sp. 1P08PE]|uniref:endonuclease domain-containing protein n=1 Tax=Sphingomonas sp. 1P08PE TaxID=554122 RepID=UPI0039A3643D